MKKAVILLFVIVIASCSGIVAQGNNGKFDFNFCNLKGKTTLTQIENCELKSSSNNSLPIKSFDLSYQIKDKMEKVNVAGNKIPSELFLTLKAAEDLKKIKIENVITINDGVETKQNGEYSLKIKKGKRKIRARF